MRAAILAAGLTVAAIQAYAQVVEHRALPSDTDPAITNFNLAHIAFINTNERLNTLVLFLPGSDSSPHSYTNFVMTAAEMGYHALSLMYPNSPLINQDCTNTPADCDCHGKARMEVLTGTNFSPVVEVNRASSIENRLIKALQYLEAHHPGENWTQYLNGASILWTNVIVAGHSQGAGHAGFIAKKHSVVRCGMFSDNDWCYSANAPANWLSEPGATPVSKVFGFVHALDTLAVSNQVVANWQAYGLTQFGGIHFVEEEGGPPFGGSHTLMTRLNPNQQGPIAYHDAPVVDHATPVSGVGYAFMEVWEFFLNDWISGHSFDGDSQSDIGVYNDRTGQWFLLHSFDPFTIVTFGYNGTDPVERDYDGDGRLDLGVYDPNTGFWSLLRSRNGETNYFFGYRGAEPVPADYDGDGKVDIAVFDDNSGTWYLQRSQAGYTSAQFGYRGSKPVPADYDGDRRADLAVYDDSSGMWYLMRSTLGYTNIQFGYRGTKPVPGDYDNDGREDIGVYDPNNGTWYLQRTLKGYDSFQFGFAGTIPVNRDYDADGKADPGVFDPQTDTWYLRQSNAGFKQQQFGFGQVVPLGTPPQ
jgi:hypothetical protein